MHIQQKIIQTKVQIEAKKWLGTPYQHQASLKYVGCDCLGLLRGIWRNIYGQEPETIPNYAPRWHEHNDEDLLTMMANKYFTPMDASNCLWGGDLILFEHHIGKPVRHIGIMLDNAHFIHAYIGKGVVENSMSPWWMRHISSHYQWPTL